MLSHQMKEKETTKHYLSMGVHKSLFNYPFFSKGILLVMARRDYCSVNE